MPIILTNRVLPDPFSKEPIERNFLDVTSFQGNIADKDITFSDPIPTSKMRATKISVIYQLKYAGGAGLPAPATYMDYAPVAAYDQTATGSNTWTVDSASWMCTDCGDGTVGQVKVVAGYFNNAGTFQVTDTVVSDHEIEYPSAGYSTANQGVMPINDGTTTPTSTFGKVFALVCVATGTNLLTTAADELVVSVKLTRLISTT